MSDSLDVIKAYKTIDLDNFEIRGSKSGINNARSTGVLFDNGSYFLPKNILTGDTSVSFNDATAILYPSSFNTSILVTGDIVKLGHDTLVIDSVIDSNTYLFNKQTLPTASGRYTTAQYNLIGRDYLIEPDVAVNTFTGIASFHINDSTIHGIDTNWGGHGDLAVGDAIQSNDYQKYFTIQNIVNSNKAILSTNYTGPDTVHEYTAKRWRLDRLKYQYVKNNFTYAKNDGRWEYDATTGSGLTATSDWSGFVDGINLKFSPTINPKSYPDIMDSNLALNKLLAKKTVYEMQQFALPAVPKPEESLAVKINGSLKDRFPNGNKDYVVNYWQSPVYEYPPPEDQRTIANLMFLNGITNASLTNTSAGVLAFIDQNGNTVSGIMPGSENITVDGTIQTRYQDYVIDTNSGYGYMTEHKTAEIVVDPIMVNQSDLFDTGLNITLRNVPQKLTIPRNDSDDVLFGLESGSLKPANKDTPGYNEEYIINYYTEGPYIDNELSQVIANTNWIRTLNYPIKAQSVIAIKNGVILNEGTDFRVSCLTGRVVFFENLTIEDQVVLNYSPLVHHKNGLSFSNETWYCHAYDTTASVISSSPLNFGLINQALLGDDSVVITRVYNVTKNKGYQFSGYSLNNLALSLPLTPYNASINTSLNDVVLIDYTFINESTEYAPVETINTVVQEGTDYLAVINKNVSVSPDTVIRFTNVDSAGDYYFRTASSLYDGEDTAIYFKGTTPTDLINPTIYFSDIPVSFSFGDYADPISSGSSEIHIPGINVVRKYRVGALVSIGDDIYSINNSSYDSTANWTVVNIGVPTYRAYSDLQVAVSYSMPVYYEGDTVVIASDPIITDPLAPGMSLTYNGIASITKDSSSFSVDIGSSHYTFLDSSHQNLLSLENALTAIDMTVTDFAPQWLTAKINTFSNINVTADSNTLISLYPSLRYMGKDVDSTAIADGFITLSNPLKSGDFYELDYLGLNALNDKPVSYSGSFFVNLPANSKVEASFRYDNIDQFYIQVMGQRDFLSSIIEPRMQEEAYQQSDNVGQGGDIPGDEDLGNAEGGLTTLEYKRVDTAIECRIFNNIFDYYNGRLQAFADEMYSIKGWKLLNNDGLLSEDDQSTGTLPISRVFPWANYTGFSPLPTAGVAGQSIPYAKMGPQMPNINTNGLGMALFINGSADVTSRAGYIGHPSYWQFQLKSGDSIRPIDATRDFTILRVNNDSSVTLTEPFYMVPRPVKRKKRSFFFGGGNVFNRQEYYRALFGVPYVINSKFPLYDDDGFTGAKFVGEASDGFGLVNGDYFNLTVDGSNQILVFTGPDEYLSEVDGPTVARAFNSYFVGVKTSYEWVPDSDSPSGYNSALVLRTDGTRNSLILHEGPAIYKLGFDFDSTSVGNNDLNVYNTYAQPEYFLNATELSDLVLDLAIVNNILNIGSPESTPHSNMLDRTSPLIHSAMANFVTLCDTESSIIRNAMDRLTVEIASLGYLTDETTSSFSGTWGSHSALIAAKQQLLDCSSAYAYDRRIVDNLEGHVTYDGWTLDMINGNQNINGRYSTGPDLNVGVSASSGTNIAPILGSNSFILKEATGRHFLSSYIGLNNYAPTLKYIDNSLDVDGYWTGWWTDITGHNNYNYSQNNKITFHLNDATPLMYLKQTSPTYSHSYFIDGAGVGVTADGTYRYYSYSDASNCTVAGMKAHIKSDFLTRGLDTTGNTIYDFKPSGFKPIGSFSAQITIPPDAAFSACLRGCHCAYTTVDNSNLNTREIFSSATRKNILDHRNTFLTGRDSAIRGAILSEEYLRSTDSTLGNLYDWVDNRFNRSNGCEARLIQVTKQQEMNRSSLGVSSRFIR